MRDDRRVASLHAGAVAALERRAFDDIVAISTIDRRIQIALFASGHIDAETWQRIEGITRR